MTSVPGSGMALLRSPNDILIDSQFRNQKTDPGMPPEHEPGDGWIVMGMLVGALAGGIGGFYFGLATGVISPYFGGAAGAVGFGMAGTFIGDAIKKLIRRKRRGRRTPRSET
jgi:hypothetical protein